MSGQKATAVTMHTPRPLRASRVAVQDSEVGGCGLEFVGLGFGVVGVLGLSFWGFSGFRVLGFGLSGLGLGCWIWVSAFRVDNLGFGVGVSVIGCGV